MIQNQNYFLEDQEIPLSETTTSFEKTWKQIKSKSKNSNIKIQPITQPTNFNYVFPYQSLLQLSPYQQRAFFEKNLALKVCLFFKF
jgi:hypothetical protein